MQSRLPELDAIRGIAAVVVMLFHCCIMWYQPGLFDASLTWVLLYPLVAGHEAVILFFLLSGLVLALPMLKGGEQPYGRFLIRRVLRIYGPYFVALVFSVIGAALWHRPDWFGKGPGNTWTEPVSWGLLVQHILFLGSYKDHQYNMAFWSLVYELRISLIYPFLFLIVQKVRTRSVLLAAILTTLLSEQLMLRFPQHNTVWKTFEYTAIFACGILIARHRKDIRVWYERLGRMSRAALFLAAYLLYNGGHRLSDLHGMWRFASCSIVAGAAGFVVVGLNSPVAQKILDSRVPQFLGKVSYSLYLVHGTILFAITALLYSKVPTMVCFVLYLVTAISASYAFHVCVEAPFIAKSRSVGSRNTVSSLSR